MKRTRFSEEQIIGILKESEAGAKKKERCSKHRIPEATFYNWKAKYAGMTVSEARRLRELEHENAKLIELEQAYYRQCEDQTMAASLTLIGLRRSRQGSWAWSEYRLSILITHRK